MAIEKTIGLRVPPGDEDNLDHVQQGVEAYHLDPIPGLPSSVARPTAGEPDATHLVTDLLDP